jgi:putative spermidine/putrescine transport system substrate-binding protein
VARSGDFAARPNNPPVAGRGCEPGGQAGDAAIKTFQDPQLLVGPLAALGNGPSNPASDALVPLELNPIKPGFAENQAVKRR